MHAQDEFDIILLPARCILTRSGSTSGGSGSAADLNMLKLAEGNSNQGFSAYTPAAPRDRQWHDCLLCNTQRPIRAGSLRKRYHNVCCTCPSFGASFGPSQYFPQYARQTRIGACVASIVLRIVVRCASACFGKSEPSERPGASQGFFKCARA